MRCVYESVSHEVRALHIGVTGMVLMWIFLPGYLLEHVFLRRCKAHIPDADAYCMDHESACSLK